MKLDLHAKRLLVKQVYEPYLLNLVKLLRLSTISFLLNKYTINEVCKCLFDQTTFIVIDKKRSIKEK
jgi:hypothetical protein